MIDLVLRPGRERSVERRHPWVLSGSVAQVTGAAEPGALVRVVGADKKVLGFGHYSPSSQLRVRMISFGVEAPDEPALLEGRIHEAVKRRTDDPGLAGTDALRLVNAEGDYLPGLTVDRFGPVLVVKLTTAGMVTRREVVARALRAATGAEAAVERADETALKREGVEVEDGPLWGEAPEGLVTIDERGRRYGVDVALGQKTGFYLDQRDARDLAEQLARGRSTLDLYAHTGGFAVAAAKGGASKVVLVESSKDALAVARRNVELNTPGLEAEYFQADVHKFLREHTEQHDLVVCDPPPLAKSKHDVDRAARAYKDSLLYSMLRTKRDGLLFAFSCSHHVGIQLFRQIVFGASLDAKRPLQVLRELGQPADHPVSIDHPEGAYLTGLLMRVSS